MHTFLSRSRTQCAVQTFLTHFVSMEIRTWRKNMVTVRVIFPHLDIDFPQQKVWQSSRSVAPMQSFHFACSGPIEFRTRNWRGQRKKISSLSITNEFFLRKWRITIRTGEHSATFENLSQLNLIEDKLYVCVDASDLLQYFHMHFICECVHCTRVHRKCIARVNAVCRHCCHRSSKSTSAIQVRVHFYIFRGTTAPAYRGFVHCIFGWALRRRSTNNEIWN